MENEYLRNTKTRYEPHVLEDVVDPVKNGHSLTWHGLRIAALALEVFDIGLFIGTLNRDILFKVGMFNIITPLTALAFIAIPTAWFWYAGSQKRFDETLDKRRFRKRVKTGYEKISKYGETTPVNAIKSVTGIESFDSATGMSKHLVNTKKWTMEDHPYQGNRAFDVLAYVKVTDDEEVIIENLYEVRKAIKDGGILIRTVMYTGETICDILDDIKLQLSDPNISEVRQKALYSIYNHYSGREGNFEPIYLIHFGLPYTMSYEKAIEFMATIRDEFEKPLNEYGIETVLIKNADLMKTILNGMFSGIVNITGDINEY